MNKFILPLSDFNRIHQVAHGVLKDVGKVEGACVFFAIFGAYVLEHKYGIKARPVAGGFSLRIDDDRNLIYGREEGNEWLVDDEGYHMWVQTDTHALDFTSPIYREVFAVAAPDVQLPRKMFQKQLADSKGHLDDIGAVGDFLVAPDPRLTNLMIERFMAKPAGGDLIQIADYWFGNRRSKQAQVSSMMNDLGEVTTLRLPSIVANGTW